MYCSNAVYQSCASACRGICERDSAEFPCYCVSDPERQCPTDTILVPVTYYDDWDAKYETRGWTSELASTAFTLGKVGKHGSKSRVLNFLFSLQNEDGSFPDKWGYKTEEPGTLHWIWASEQHSVIRTSIIFRVLASLLVPSAEGQLAGLISVAPESAALAASDRDPAMPEVAKQPPSDRESALSFSPSMVEGTSIFPNPSSGNVRLRFTLPEGTEQIEQTGQIEQIGMIIVDIAGRTIKSLGRSLLNGDRVEVSWDGTDDSGRRVAPGVYFAQAIGEGWRSAKKLVILGQ